MTDKDKIRNIIELFIAWNGETDVIDIANIDSAVDFISDSLQVEDVDLEKEYKDFVEEDPVYNQLVNGVVGKAIAKHFFELGLKAKNWEKERMEECPYRQVGCTMYEGKILECRGACSWVVDYPKLKEFKSQKGEE